ncbi:MAG: DUF6261 family protein [Bacteroidia bacterium]
MEKIPIMKFPCGLLYKEEVPGLVNDVVVLITKHNPTVYHIESMFNMLKEIQPELKALNSDIRKYPRKEELNELQLQCNDLLVGFSSHLRGLQKAKMPGQLEWIRLVNPVLERYLSNSLNGTKKIKREYIGQLKIANEQDAVLHAAFVGLGLDVYINELNVIQGKIDLLIENRTEYLSNIPISNTKRMKNVAGKALKNLFSAIHLASLEHSDLDYNPMIIELNKLITLYKSEVKLRQTKQKHARMAKISDAKTAAVLTTTSNTTAV